MTPLSPIDTHATISFLEPDSRHDTEKPFTIRYIPHDPLPEKNFVEHAVSDIRISDVRPFQNKLSLDGDGVEILDMESQMTHEDFFNFERVKGIYAEEVRDLLTRRLGARKVFFHECVLRKRSKASVPEDTPEYRQKIRYGRPVNFAHADFTLQAIIGILTELCGPSKAPEILSQRYQAFNVWKPLKGPLRDWPLAWCSLSSLQSEDMLTTDDVYKEGTNEYYRLRYNPSQEWRYLANQRPEELVVFKTADSLEEGCGAAGELRSDFSLKLCAAKGEDELDELYES